MTPVHFEVPWTLTKNKKGPKVHVGDVLSKQQTCHTFIKETPCLQVIGTSTFQFDVKEL